MGALFKIKVQSTCMLIPLSMRIYPYNEDPLNNNREKEPISINGKRKSGNVYSILIFVHLLGYCIIQQQLAQVLFHQLLRLNVVACSTVTIFSTKSTELFFVLYFVSLLSSK